MKIVIVGAGNAGCFTALHFGWHTRFVEEIEIELVYDPNIISERVGQATLFSPPILLGDSIGFNWYNNIINATPKTGILYEGWGNKNDKWFHGFPNNNMAMHYCPWEMQKAVLKSGYFKVTEGDVDPKDVDADYVFDCRGKPKDYSGYDELVNPTNACLLGKPNWNTTKALWSRHVATPDGWTFIIPTHSNSPSHNYSVGYCYNDNITSKLEVQKNCLEMFDVDLQHHVQYKNYVVKNPIVDDRIILSGNRLFFLEPMESSSVEAYITWSRFIFDSIVNGKKSLKDSSEEMKMYIKQLQNYILWHYQVGSKYDTPFWNYAKGLTFKDDLFDSMLAGDNSIYGQWKNYNFSNWYRGMISK